MRTVAVLALLALPWAGWADDEQEKRAEQEQMRLELREQAEHLKEWRGDVMQSIQKMKRESSDAPPAVAGLLKQKISLHEEMVKAMDTKIAAHNAADFEAIEAAEKKMGEKCLEHGPFRADATRTAEIYRTHFQQAHITMRHTETIWYIIDTGIDGEEAARCARLCACALVDQLFHFGDGMQFIQLFLWETQSPGQAR